MRGTSRDSDAKLKSAAEQFLSLGLPDTTQEQEAQLRESLSKDPSKRRAFEEVAQAWRMMELARGSSEVAETLARYSSGNIQPSNRRLSRRHLLAAASVLVALVASIVFYLNGSGHRPQRYQTRFAEQSIALLTDGSTMHLNSRSEVQVSYSAAERHVELIDGEATFRVEHDVTRPFLVVVDGVSVRAVGTEFNVRRENDTLAVSVLEGVVEVVGSADDLLHRHPWRQELPVGRVLRLDHSTAAIKVEIGSSDIARIKGWQAGRLVFQNEPLHSVVEAVNRNLGTGPIVIADPSIRDLPVTMNFDIKQSKDFVSAVLLGFPVEAEYLGNGEVHLRAKPDVGSSK